jgi:hypothetical protein
VFDGILLESELDKLDTPPFSLEPVVVQPSYYYLPSKTKRLADLNPNTIEDAEEKIFACERFIPEHTAEVLSGRSVCYGTFPLTSKENVFDTISLDHSSKLTSVHPGHTNFYFHLRSVRFMSPISKFNPVFFTFALYSLSRRVKLTEDIHIDTNQMDKPPLLNMIETLKDAQKSPYYSNTTLSRAMFQINLSFKDYLVFLGFAFCIFFSVYEF